MKIPKGIYEKIKKKHLTTAKVLLYRDKTMADKLMYIPNDGTSPSIHKNYWLKRLNTQHFKPNNLTSVKVPIVVKKTNKKTLL